MKHSEQHNLLADVLLWILPLALILPNIALDITEISYSGLTRIVNIAIPGGLWILLSGFWRHIGRTSLATIPLMVLGAFQIVLLFLYGESIIAIDMFLNVVTTNAKEASELLGNLITGIITVLAIYLPVIIITIICLSRNFVARKYDRTATRAVGLTFLTAGIICYVASFLTTRPVNLRKEIFPVNVICNMVEAGHREWLTENYHRTSADFTFEATTASPDSLRRVIVMVVGETSRADNWSLGGYDRETNPQLSQRDNFLFFPRALSESNTTHKSVPLLLSHLDGARFGDSIYNVKSIFKAFEEAGYKTAWISNQRRNHGLIDFFGAQADEVHFLVDESENNYDMDLIPRLEQFVAANPDNSLLIVLHTYGSHFNYIERYPDEYSLFGPIEGTDANKKNRTSLINAYDNSILYTDAMLDSLASTLEALKRPVAMLYTSDHGEDIFDDSRERFLHASPTPTYTQLHVPFLLWVSDNFRQSIPDKYSAAEANLGAIVSSSRSVFHTLLDLADITTPYFQPEASICARTYNEPALIYLNDYNQGVPLGEAGLRKQDFKRLSGEPLNVVLTNN